MCLTWTEAVSGKLSAISVQRTSRQSFPRITRSEVLANQDQGISSNSAAAVLWRGSAGRVRSSAVAKAMADRPSGPLPARRSGPTFSGYSFNETAIADQVTS